MVISHLLTGIRIQVRNRFEGGTLGQLELHESMHFILSLLVVSNMNFIVNYKKGIILPMDELIFFKMVF